MYEYNLPEIDKEGLTGTDIINRERYKNIYIRLIKRCICMTDKELSGYNEVHHILPRCMGGSDSEENLVTMPVKYHILAHILLFRIYPSGKTAGSINCLLGDKKYSRLVAQKAFSLDLLTKVRKDIVNSLKEGGNPNSKQVISPFGVIYNSITSASKAEGIPYDTLTKWLSGEISSHGWSYYLCSKVDYNKIKRDMTLSSKKVISPSGVIYDSIALASKTEKIPYTTLRYWLSGRVKDNHGWKFSSGLTN